MKRIIVRLLCLAALVMWLAPQASAAPQVPLKITKVDVAAYSELLLAVQSGSNGEREVLDTGGKVFVSITVLIDPQWTQDTKRAKVEAKQIVLEIGGQKVRMLGYMRYLGQLNTYSHNFYVSKPYKWPNTVRRETYNVVFLAPKGTTDAVFHMGSVSAPVKIPIAISPTPNPATGVKAELVSAKMIPSVHRQTRVSGQKFGTTITNPAGGILEVKVRMTPTKPNSIDSPNQFFWTTSWFAIQYDGSGMVGCMGEQMRDKKLHRNVSHSRSSGGSGFRTDDVTLYFLAPANAGRFKLLLLGNTVAQGQVGAATSTSASAPAPAAATKADSGKAPQPAPAGASVPPPQDAGKKKGLLRRLMGK